MTLLNETHDPARKSWVTSANGHEQFPIQNLPFAIFREVNTKDQWRGGVAIGDSILDMAKVAALNLLHGDAKRATQAASETSLNTLMGLGATQNSALRLALSNALLEGSEHQAALESCLIAQADAEFNMPCHVTDYTDFYTSIHHATAVGSLFRPDNPLLPNYKWVPIGYHGRSSSIGVSGQTFPRPVGQTKKPDAITPDFGPCQRLDYELEMGVFIGQGTTLGHRIKITEAEQHIFGMCILNDWSARDIQAWEYQPLGPFLAKNFASTISPWIVTTEALAPFREAFTRPESDPQPLEYLTSEANTQAGNLDIALSCLIQTEKMRQNDQTPQQLSASNFIHSYWTPAQLVTHHSVNGCPMTPGDLLGSGTQSGPEADEAGSLLELTQGGKKSLTLDNGETRKFLEDGDAIIMRAHCRRDGAVTIGFGEVVGTLLPAVF
ncbi:fumarylacetoacetase [Paraglaciecola mesophila KMM 241]|uniref:fumarylacetoacetase n=1 Tax=Paraglaciecola mesophila KMM 241 TaxID=1128912 RepID=K6Z5U6_9ALTE|nr:fumarylacetoacetase [Paraglaciecola mesophila]GAC24358.1 fumarylacetoacetase [Paraglaciecola mesophila KMM 241]